MTAAQMFALLPIITLTVGILVLLMVIAFSRSLAATAIVSMLSLALTAAAFVVIAPAAMTDGGVVVTPLLVVDGFAVLLGLLLTLASIAVAGLSWDYLSTRGDLQEEFLLLLLLAALGAIILASSAHVASFMLGLEMLGVSLYGMIAYPMKGVLSLEAALKYLILSGVSSAFILFGAALMYADSGSMDFRSISALTSADSLSLMASGGSALFLAGIAFKLSLVPFHMWTPDVYEGAPAPVTGFLATVSKTAVFAVLVRAFLPEEGTAGGATFWGLWCIAIGSMLVGNLLALMQKNVKRLLGYSSIAQLGYLLVAFLAGSAVGGSELAVEASLYFLFAYVPTTLAAFGVVAIMSRDAGEQDTDQIEAYRGLFWRRPFLAFVLTAAMLSLAGIPLTGGFLGKFYVVASGVQAELWWLVGALVVGSGMGVFYYLRIIFAMTQDADGARAVPVPFASGMLVGLLTIALVVLGVYPMPMIDLIAQVIASVTWV
jgi:NADH-quinone oxidoreductase subunit N